MLSKNEKMLNNTNTVSVINTSGHSPTHTMESRATKTSQMSYITWVIAFEALLKKLCFGWDIRYGKRWMHRGKKDTTTLINRPFQ